MTNVNTLIERAYQKNNYDYASYEKYRGLPIIGWTFGYHADQMEYQENQRYWSDFARNTGANLSNFNYPIRAGLYRGANYYGTAFNNANMGVMNLYRKLSYKKPEINIHNHRQIHNHGNYYRYGDFVNYQR